MNRLNITNVAIPETYYGFIFITTFPNGMIYVGQTTGRVNREYFGSGGVDFKAAVKEFGKGNLKREIIKFVNNHLQIDTFETYLIRKKNCVDRKIGYNTLPGTAHNWGVGNPSKLPSVRLKMSLKAKGRGLGIKKSEKAKKNMSDAQKRRFEDKDEREKYVKILRKVSDNKPMLNKRHTKESRLKMSKARKGTQPRLGAVLSQSTKDKIRESVNRNYELKRKQNENKNII